MEQLATSASKLYNKSRTNFEKSWVFVSAHLPWFRGGGVVIREGHGAVDSAISTSASTPAGHQGILSWSMSDLCPLPIHPTPTGEKPHKCELCDFTCRDVSYLSKHMLTHSSTKDYMCTECGYVTKWKHYLSVHMRKHAGDLRHARTCASHPPSPSGRGLSWLKSAPSPVSLLAPRDSSSHPSAPVISVPLPPTDPCLWARLRPEPSETSLGSGKGAQTQRRGPETEVSFEL